MRKTNRINSLKQTLFIHNVARSKTKNSHSSNIRRYQTAGPARIRNSFTRRPRRKLRHDEIFRVPHPLQDRRGLLLKFSTSPQAENYPTHADEPAGIRLRDLWDDLRRINPCRYYIQASSAAAALVGSLSERIIPWTQIIHPNHCNALSERRPDHGNVLPRIDITRIFSTFDASRHSRMNFQGFLKSDDVSLASSCNGTLSRGPPNNERRESAYGARTSSEPGVGHEAVGIGGIRGLGHFPGRLHE